MGISGLKLPGRLKRRFERKAIILMYHRVAEVNSDPWSLCVSPRHFAEQVEVVRRQASPISLRQLIEHLRPGSIPRRAVVVTFDDGYADNLYNGKPALERHDVPATAFVSTGHTGRRREFWWDELQRLLLEPGDLPETLELRVGGTEYQWGLGETASYSDEEYVSHRRWLAWGQPDPSSRHFLFRTIYQLMHPLTDDERRATLDDLLAWSGAGPSGRAAYYTLSREEILTLAEGGLVEVGSHMVTHPQLASLPAGAQREEIQRSKAALEDTLGRRVTSFAYPYGRRCDYTEETVAIVKQAGYVCACSNFPGLIGRGADGFQLPRFQAHDMDGEAFARQLATWFGG